MIRTLKVLAVVLAISMSLAQDASAALDFSFTGMFTRDDNVQSFSFVVGATSNVTLRTWSYAGGTNAANQVIARGGFDPILALFDSTGALIDQNDDGGPSNVASDSVSGFAWDTFLTATLAPGTYTVSIQQYDNFALGPNISNGYARAGQGNFTTGLTGFTGPFRDVSGSEPGNIRDGHWAFDILNVEAAVQDAVPEPTSLALWGLGALGCAVAYRRRRRA